MRCLRIFATPGRRISFDDVDDKAACSSDAGARKAPSSTLAWAPRQEPLRPPGGLPGCGLLVYGRGGSHKLRAKTEANKPKSPCQAQVS